MLEILDGKGAVGCHMSSSLRGDAWEFTQQGH